MVFHIRASLQICLWTIHYSEKLVLLHIPELGGYLSHCWILKCIIGSLSKSLSLWVKEVVTTVKEHEELKLSSW